MNTLALRGVTDAEIRRRVAYLTTLADDWLTPHSRAQRAGEYFAIETITGVKIEKYVPPPSVPSPPPRLGVNIFDREIAWTCGLCQHPAESRARKHHVLSHHDGLKVHEVEWTPSRPNAILHRCQHCGLPFAATTSRNRHAAACPERCD